MPRSIFALLAPHALSVTGFSTEVFEDQWSIMRVDHEHNHSFLTHTGWRKMWDDEIILCDYVTAVMMAEQADGQPANFADVIRYGRLGSGPHHESSYEWWHEFDVNPDLEADELIVLTLDSGIVEMRCATLPDGIARKVSTMTAGVDFRNSLPEGTCPAPNWGRVLEGSITVQFADGSTRCFFAGDPYYWPGGHVGWTDEGVTLIDFSPAEQITPCLKSCCRSRSQFRTAGSALQRRQPHPVRRQRPRQPSDVSQRGRKRRWLPPWLLRRAWSASPSGPPWPPAVWRAGARPSSGPWSPGSPSRA